MDKKSKLEKTEEYWTERLTSNQFKKHTKKMDKEILRIYKEATKEIEACVKDIWLEMLSDGEISVTALYNYNRYKTIQEVINEELIKLGKAEVDIINAHLEDAYIKTFGEATVELGGQPLDKSWGIFNKQNVNSIVNANFKGAIWSDRVWKNKQEKLRGQIEQRIIDSAILGKDVRKVSKELSERMGVSLSDSKRIVRTETMRVLNDACINSAIDRGYTHVRWLAEKDERLCTECSDLDGTIFVIYEAPSIVHPNCRCTVLPVIN